MKDITKKYSNDEITIVWKPSVCIHSAICWRGTAGLPEVFDPSKRPWINPEGASTEKIIEKINQCPSGALSYYHNHAPEEKPTESAIETIIESAPNGPLMVYGNISIKKADGSVEHKHKVTAFCRCGASSNKPYCDGSHRKIGFEG
jgi:uncharacterized Fe-S cluster protein YjdI